MSKKWVFETLVKDDKDAVGLIAYALYKNKKHTLATSLRDEGRQELDIQREVTIFHDQTLQNDSLSDYRDKAESYLNDLFKRIAELERAGCEKKIAALEKKHLTDLKKEKAKILKNMREYQGAHKSLLDRFKVWILSGIPGIVSSFILTCFFLGASMMLVSEKKRQEVLADVASSYFGVPISIKSEIEVKSSVSGLE